MSKELIVRPPDSTVLMYTELRWIFRKWPVWLIDELAWGLSEQDNLGHY